MTPDKLIIMLLEECERADVELVGISMENEMREYDVEIRCELGALSFGDYRYLGIDESTYRISVRRSVINWVEYPE